MWLVCYFFSYFKQLFYFLILWCVDGKWTNNQKPIDGINGGLLDVVYLKTCFSMIHMPSSVHWHKCWYKKLEVVHITDFICNAISKSWLLLLPEEADYWASPPRRPGLSSIWYDVHHLHSVFWICFDTGAAMEPAGKHSHQYRAESDNAATHSAHLLLKHLKRRSY